MKRKRKDDEEEKSKKQKISHVKNLLTELDYLGLETCKKRTTKDLVVLRGGKGKKWIILLSESILVLTFSGFGERDFNSCKKFSFVHLEENIFILENFYPVGDLVENVFLIRSNSEWMIKNEIYTENQIEKFEEVIIDFIDLKDGAKGKDSSKKDKKFRTFSIGNTSIQLSLPFCQSVPFLRKILENEGKLPIDKTEKGEIILDPNFITIDTLKIAEERFKGKSLTRILFDTRKWGECLYYGKTDDQSEYNQVLLYATKEFVFFVWNENKYSNGEKRVLFFENFSRDEEGVSKNNMLIDCFSMGDHDISISRANGRVLSISSIKISLLLSSEAILQYSEGEPPCKAILSLGGKEQSKPQLHKLKKCKIE